MENSESIKIRNVELCSRYFLAPINTGLAKDGNPTTELINFHGLRSNKYTGISYVGNVAIDSESITNANTLFASPRMKMYDVLAAEIAKHGSIPGAQVACMKTAFQAQRNWRNASRDQYIQYVREETEKLKTSEIKKIIRSFSAAIKQLIDSGFRAIQIHGAHGYFLNNFLSATFNGRKDEFGRDRTLIIKEILDGISTVSGDVIVDLRISVFEDKLLSQLTENHIKSLNELSILSGIDMISISNGIYNIDKKLIYPTKARKESFMYHLMEKYMLDNNEKKWNICGNIRNLQSLSTCVENATFSIGRPLLADHDFIRKQYEARQHEIVECDYKNKCHYFSANKDHIECGVNKRLY